MAETIQAADAAPAPPPAYEPPPYQTLSLVALGGFVLAAVCAAAVLLGGLIPLAVGRPVIFLATLVLAPILGAAAAAATREGRNPARVSAGAGLALGAWAFLLGIGGLVVSAGTNPWVLGFAFWGLAAAAVLVCVIARYQIQASEGTLTGDWYARWGLITTLFVSLLYAAYQSSIQLAIASQARAAAREYIGLLQKGDTLQAFIRAQRERPTGVNLAMVEQARNNPTMSSPGVYTTYTCSDHVRLLRLSGEDATITEKGIKIDLSNKNTEAELIYRVAGRYFEFDLTVALEGVEVSQGSVKRRAWHVVERGTGTGGRETPPHLTEESKPLGPSFAAARGRSEAFLVALANGDIDGAFLMTRPAAGRDPKTAMTGRAAFPPPGFSDFSEAYTFNDKILAAARDGVTAALKGGPKAGLTQITPLPNINFALFTAAGGRVVFELDVQAVIRDHPAGPPGHMAFGRMQLEGPFEARAVKPEEFRVTGFKWDRVKEVQSGPRPGQGPPGG